MSFLGCLYGSHHHSFIFIGQRFVDNGFRFDPEDMPEAELAGLLTDASADMTRYVYLPLLLELTAQVHCVCLRSCAPIGEPFFEDFSHLLVNNPAKRNYGVAVTDIDNDGVFEAVVAGYGNENLAYQWDPVEGNFADVAMGEPVLQDATRQAIGVAACDIDGDGYEELCECTPPSRHTNEAVKRTAK
eukprot:SAG31_NODE_2445_length_5681_cov_18.644930_7_plen_186_part_01